ncbi:T9SS type A sorting domain-containing protein [uncultured Polaribacter sp.]|uniref:T9SS type A sorting domain-containing protein n=1 Tax=uncultured Polaribacter sp. TaxID=174711 RepID=UPI0026359DA7|nr:T9SS type A sorting domain-containing protein [uncultured Polaribacter sp.]
MNKTTFSKTFNIFKILIFTVCLTQAQTDFPYDPLPLSDGAFNNTLTINTSTESNAFNNLLLGSNVDFNTSIARILLSRAPLFTSDGTLVNARAANQGFNSLEGQEFIADNDPVVLRFPQGVFANTYHWEPVFNDEEEEIAAADSRHITDPFVVGTRVISQHDSPTSVRIGYPSLRKIFDTAASNGKPLDLLTVLSIIGNDADSNGRRWQSMIEDGHNVRDMELGNEFFFRSQRSGTINTEAQWVARAREVVANIKNRANQENREVRFAIPISFRGGDPAQSTTTRNFHQRYNDAITVDESFFDAIVVHRYVNAQRESGNRPENLTEQSLRDLVSASRIMDQSLTYSKTQVSEDKDAIWLTEWGVAGSEEDGIGASFLGAADIYSHIINNNDRLEVERINWFSTVGLNAQYTVSGSRGNIQIGTTGYGDVYRVLRDNLRDSELFNSSSLESPELKIENNTQEDKPLHVIAVRRPDGKPRLLVTNKTDVNARIFINRDGNSEDVVNYAVDGIRWENLASTTTIAYSDAQTSVDAIIIPPYSLVKVDVSFGEGVSVLSVDDSSIVNNSKSIQVYPNPASNRFNIALNGFETANIVIRDVLGKIVLQTKTDEENLQLDVNGVFGTGVYFVTVLDENRNSYFKRLIVE